MELARHRSNLRKRTRIARGLGIVRSSNATLTEGPIPLVSTRVGGQADRILSRQESAAALEQFDRFAADVVLFFFSRKQQAKARKKSGGAADKTETIEDGGSRIANQPEKFEGCLCCAISEFGFTSKLEEPLK